MMDFIHLHILQQSNSDKRKPPSYQPDGISETYQPWMADISSALTTELYHTSYKFTN